MCRSAKEFESAFHVLYECDALAAHNYFFLGLGKLNPKSTGKNPSKIIPGFRSWITFCPERQREAHWAI